MLKKLTPNSAVGFNIPLSQPPAANTFISILRQVEVTSEEFKKIREVIAFYPPGRFAISPSRQL